MDRVVVVNARVKRGTVKEEERSGEGVQRGTERLEVKLWKVRVVVRVFERKWVQCGAQVGRGRERQQVEKFLDGVKWFVGVLWSR